MKKLLSMLLIGVILIGVGTGVSIFEFSSYRLEQQPTGKMFTPTTTVLTHALPNTEGPIYFANFHYHYNQYQATIAIDDSLQNEVRVEVTGPSQIYKYALSNYNQNSLYFYYEIDPFKGIAAFLEAAKDKVFFNFDSAPTISLVIYANEADSKRLVIGEDPAIAQERNTLDEMEENYRTELDNLRSTYESSLAEMQANFESQLDNRSAQQDELQTNYESQISELRENYEEQLRQQKENYEEQIQQQKENYEEQIQQLQNN